MINLERKSKLLEKEERFRREVNLTSRSMYFIRYAGYNEDDSLLLSIEGDTRLGIIRELDSLRIFRTILKESSKPMQISTLDKCIGDYYVIGNEMLWLLQVSIGCIRPEDSKVSGDLNFLYTMLGNSIHRMSRSLSNTEYNMLDVLMIDNSFLAFDIVSIDSIDALQLSGYKEYCDNHEGDFIISHQFNYIIRRVSNLDSIISILPKHNCSSHKNILIEEEYHGL